MPLLDKSAFADPTLPVPSWRNIKGAVRGLMGAVTPPDPYEEAGRMVQQARGGDYLGALETGFGAMPTTGAIKAYHGSPHSFDKFDLSKIGTGEGAQAYGHGLYFADNEAVARAYRDQLKPVPKERFAQPHLTEAAKSFVESGTTPEDTVSALRNIYKNATDEQLKLAVREADPRFDPWSGHMYEVRINAEPEHFLDWDKPLSAQPYVRERLGLTPEHIDELVSPTNRSFFEPGKYEALREDPPGNYAWFHAKNTAGDPAAASEALRKAGIPGIKYLDQGSRGAGEGSRNYVVFDDKLVDIARKYGLLPLGMGGFDFSQNEQK